MREPALAVLLRARRSYCMKGRGTAAAFDGVRSTPFFQIFKLKYFTAFTGVVKGLLYPPQPHAALAISSDPPSSTPLRAHRPCACSRSQYSQTHTAFPALYGGAP